MAFNADGSPNNNFSTTQYCYSEVPDNNSDHHWLQSIAGRHYSGDYMEVCFYDYTSNGIELHTKEFAWGQDYFRKRTEIITMPLTANTNGSLIYPNPSNASVIFDLSGLNAAKNYSVAITDIAGRRMTSFSGNTNDISKYGAKAIEVLRTGTYFITVYDGKKIVVNKKISRL